MNGLKIVLYFGIIPLLMICVSFWNLHKKFKGFSWRMLKKNLAGFYRFRFWILLPSFLFTGIFIWQLQRENDSQSSAIVTLNYEEASKGQNANGTRYNMSEIICDEVIERAIKKGAFENVSAEDLKKCLSVEPVVQGNSYDENQYHISTEFFLNYTESKKTQHLDADTVVQLISDAYKEFYIEKYADNFEVLKIKIDPEKDFADMDYMDTASWLSNKAAGISRYMYELADKNTSFVSSNGITFSSIAGKADDLNQIQITDSLQSYLLYNGISKDKDLYVGRLEYNNSRLDFEQQEADAYYKVRNDAIALYAEEMTRVVLVPTWDEEGEYYMGRTKVGIDTLSVEAEDYSKQAAEYAKTIESNTATIDAMRNPPGNGSSSEAEEMIASISRQIEQLAKEARGVGQEYSEGRMNQCITSNIIRDSFMRDALFTGTVFVIFFLSLNLLISSVTFSKEKGVSAARTDHAK